MDTGDLLSTHPSLLNGKVYASSFPESSSRFCKFVLPSVNNVHTKKKKKIQVCWTLMLLAGDYGKFLQGTSELE